MRLALFDLDHTLIPFDSGMAWTKVPPCSTGAIEWWAALAWVDATPLGRPVVPEV